MRSSEQLLAFHIHFECMFLKPYICPAGKPTIGIGMTFYPNGKTVTMNDKPLANRHEAIKLWRELIITFERQVESLTKGVTLSQNQFDALVDFQYNSGRLLQSTLLKKIKINPKDKSIWGEFLKYTKARADNDKKDNDGDGLTDEPGELGDYLGLIRRRNAEAHLYFLGEINYYEQLKMAA